MRLSSLSFRDIRKYTHYVTLRMADKRIECDRVGYPNSKEITTFVYVDRQQDVLITISMMCPANNNES